jgi:hypothetical protein
LLAVVLFVQSVAVAGTPMDAVKAKQVLAKRGIGKGVKVTQADGTEVVGTLLSIGDNQFEVWPKKEAQGVFISYSMVSKVSGSGGSKAWLYPLIIGVASGVLVAFVGMRE